MLLEYESSYEILEQLFAWLQIHRLDKWMAFPQYAVLCDPPSSYSNNMSSYKAYIYKVSQSSEFFHVY